MAQSPIPGWSLLLEGAPGSGKTWSLRTLKYLHRRLKCPPLEIGILALDKNVRPGLGKWADSDEPDTAICRVKTINMVPEGEDPFEVYASMIDNIGKLGPNKIPGQQGKFNQFLSVVAALRNFKLEDGTSWGNVAKWGTNRVLVIDNLTGLTYAAQHHAIGNRPALEIQDYGTIGNVLNGLLFTLLSSATCHIVLMSHVDRETDEVKGGTKIYPSTIGRKLGPVIGKDFSDVVFQEFTDGKWVWRTERQDTDLRPGNLPVLQTLTADFIHLFETPEKGWLAKGGLISTEVAKR